MKTREKYYRALVSMGHMGSGKSRETYLYIHAKGILDAMKIAQRSPAIKHGRMPLKVIEISKEEYFKGREEDLYIKAIDQLNHGVE